MDYPADMDHPPEVLIARATGELHAMIDALVAVRDVLDAPDAPIEPISERVLNALDAVGQRAFDIARAAMCALYGEDLPDSSEAAVDAEIRRSVQVLPEERAREAVEWANSARVHHDNILRLANRDLGETIVLVLYELEAITACVFGVVYPAELDVPEEDDAAHLRRCYSAALVTFAQSRHVLADAYVVAQQLGDVSRSIESILAIQDGDDGDDVRG